MTAIQRACMLCNAEALCVYENMEILSRPNNVHHKINIRRECDAKITSST
jgi:hypothetical protein